jgi:hypothetical protein
MSPLALGRFNEVVAVHQCLIKSDTLPKVFLISKQVIPYQTLGGIGYPRGSTPKNRSFAESSKTNLKR